MRNTRRAFVATMAASLSALLAANMFASASDGKSHPPAKPSKRKPPAAPKPSAVSKALARWLQRDLKAAKLSDALTEKIAADIEGGFDITRAFRKERLANAAEPDFTFFA